jgi:deoxyribose-phosphate aldolase
VEDPDLVFTYGWIRSGKWDDVEAEFRAVGDIVHGCGSLLKVIFETPLPLPWDCRPPR